MTDSRLYTAGKINNASFKNRAMVAPMTRISATQTGVPTDIMEKYYASFARGGFGAVITEGIYIDQAWSQTYAFQPGIVTTEQVAGWSKIVKTVKNEGAVFIAQLIHGGALSQGNIYRQTTGAPSAVQPVGQQLGFYHGEGNYALPEAMSENQIQEAIEGFAASAERAVNEAGFDGVEIHSANGYLLDQFLTDYTNQRNDRWGGDIEARLTLTLEVIKAVRAKVGHGVIVGVRISQGKVNDFHHKWKEGKAGAAKVFALLQDAGVDYIHVTEYQSWKPAFANGEQTFAEIAREAAPDTIIVVNGGLDTGELAEKQLEQTADFVAVGKAALANHDWPSRVARGEELSPLPDNVLSPVANIKQSEI